MRLSFRQLLKRKEEPFSTISGYNDIKKVINRALSSEENMNILFIGPPASSKTQFLMEIIKTSKNCVYFDATNSTNRILQVLNE